MGGKLHLKLKKCLSPIARRKDAKDLEKRVNKVPEIAGREVSWTSFAW